MQSNTRKRFSVLIISLFHVGVHKGQSNKFRAFGQLPASQTPLNPTHTTSHLRLYLCPSLLTSSFRSLFLKSSESCRSLLCTHSFGKGGGSYDINDILMINAYDCVLVLSLRRDVSYYTAVLLWNYPPAVLDFLLIRLILKKIWRSRDKQPHPQLAKLFAASWRRMRSLQIGPCRGKSLKHWCARGHLGPIKHKRSSCRE